MKLRICILLTIIFGIVSSFIGCSAPNEPKIDSNHYTQSQTEQQTSNAQNSSTNNEIESQIDKENHSTSMTNNTSTLKNNGTMVPRILIWEGKLYIGSSDKLADDDLNEFLIDSENVSVYSILGESNTQKIAYRANNKVYQYTCAYATPISVNGISYTFVPKGTVTIKKLGEQPICTLDEMNIYKSDNAEYLIVDISPKVNLDEPCLYEIKKTEDATR